MAVDGPRHEDLDRQAGDIVSTPLMNARTVRPVRRSIASLDVRVQGGL
jgi:hypothetical protein